MLRQILIALILLGPNFSTHAMKQGESKVEGYNYTAMIKNLSHIYLKKAFQNQIPENNGLTIIYSIKTSSNGKPFRIVGMKSLKSDMWLTAKIGPNIECSSFIKHVSDSLDTKLEESLRRHLIKYEQAKESQ